MRTAILTISSSLARGEGEDLSGPALADAATAAGCEVELREVLADDQAAIEARLRELVADGFDVILTSGGTGLTPDDVTPEASEAVIERAVPGIAEALRAASMQFTPAAAISRATSGVAGGTLIVNMPGNPRAIGEAFPVLAPILGHAVRHIGREGGRTDGEH